MSDLTIIANQWGTKRQQEFAAMLQGHTVTETAALLGITASRVRGAMSELRRRAQSFEELAPDQLVDRLDEFPSFDPRSGLAHRKEAWASWRKQAGSGIKLAFLPDGQNKQDVPMEHWTAAGNYMAAKEPDVIVNAGDFWDMPSLSSYDEGKRGMENRRVLADVEAGNQAMDLFMAPVLEKMRKSDWCPRLVFTMGNHEERMKRYVDANPKLEGLIGYHQFNLAKYGWEVYDFQEVVEIEGCLFSHMFPRNTKGNVTASSQRMGASSADYQLRVQKQSCTAGHRQGLNTAGPVAFGGGRFGRAIIAGSFYQHDEEYMGPQGNDYWRGLIIKHELHEGNYDLMEVSLDFLLRRYL